ncbi:hypothetical protein [Kineococcus esterisolvens]|uniref:hypothetical protein n=1 Tax=unclassified Kineococcus TaxID=2621656 RepID=UPI003D7CD6E5
MSFPLNRVADGEPSCETTGRTGLAAGWWQGHEALDSEGSTHVGLVGKALDWLSLTGARPGAVKG